MKSGCKNENYYEEVYHEGKSIFERCITFMVFLWNKSVRNVFERKDIMKRNETIRLVCAGLLAALGVILPKIVLMLPLQGLVTVLVPGGKIGEILLPMHLPVLLCGFLCGYKYGAICGLIVPFLAHLFNGMPPIYPTAISMAFELAAYGAVSGFLAEKKKKLPLLATLLISMLCGRIVMGVANVILYGMKGNPYGIMAYFGSAFLRTWPGIILQLILVPLLVVAVRKSRILGDYEMGTKSKVLS